MNQESLYKLIASDLDGTLIPHYQEHASEDAHRKFQLFFHSNSNLELCYATGRHLELALEGVVAAGLPLPDYFICDVGTSLYRRQKSNWELDTEYVEQLRNRIGAETIEVVDSLVNNISGISLQEQEKQAQFKRSFYLASDIEFEVLREKLHSSIDKAGLSLEMIISQSSTGELGLLDFLPQGANKATALQHLIKTRSINNHEVIYAGDSRNDAAVFLSGIPSIAVSNISESFRLELEDSSTNNLFFATKPCIAGVIQGLLYYKVLRD